MSDTKPEPDSTDGCDHEGFEGGCERAGHTVVTCPYKPQPEPSAETPLTDAFGSGIRSIIEWKDLAIKLERRLAAAQAEVANVKAALGEHPDSEIDLVSRIYELRDQARKPFHESTASLQEKEQLRQSNADLKDRNHALCDQLDEAHALRDELRAQVEEVKRERDEARVQAAQNEYFRKALLARSTIEEENQLRAANATLTAELAKAREDKERIEWLEKNAPHELRIERDGWIRLDRWHTRYITFDSWQGRTLRAALDAARASKGAA